ncbi:cupin domain-containing protein [Mycolicibacterium goodii]|uniref:cupin domain-containing protein n=1 Tax=Mycolicibacterium goodii TaxID=134601 RepID=UPI000C2698BD|nr:cupin domain-containing protein [Mycolicibacterium goodii]MBU8832707.1 cupin domain-containing protein [Mycolicibacterium goodii]PJK20552.1 cupin [Mycolicibacterium goodii]
MLQDWPDSESGSTITVVQEVRSPRIPDQVDVMTVVVSHPPGARGAPPHRIPGGPAFGYMITGEMLFEREGEPARVLRAGDAFWGPGGDVIHYRDANLRTDIPCRFVLTMLRDPGKPLLEQVSDAELRSRKTSASKCIDEGSVETNADDDARRDRWREVTRELVLAGATATAAVDHAQSDGSISITLTGKALENDVLLADVGNIALGSFRDPADALSHPMRVIPMRLDILSDPPAVRVSGRGITGSTQLRLVVTLTACDPRTADTSVLTCQFDPVRLDPQKPYVSMDFRLHTVELYRS